MLRRPRSSGSTGARPRRARRAVDAQDVGAHVGEQHGAERAGADARRSRAHECREGVPSRATKHSLSCGASRACRCSAICCAGGLLEPNPEARPDSCGRPRDRPRPRVWRARRASAETTPFPEPKALEPAVGLLVRVYTEASTDGGFIHDARLLDVVYEHVRFRARPTARAREDRRRPREGLARGARVARAGRPPRNAREQQIVKLFRSRWAARRPRATTATRRTSCASSSASATSSATAWFARARSRTRCATCSARRAARGPRAPAARRVVVQHAGVLEVRCRGRLAVHARHGPAVHEDRLRGRRAARPDHGDPRRRAAAGRELPMLCSWPLALTAYNHGRAGMRRAERRSAPTTSSRSWRTTRAAASASPRAISTRSSSPRARSCSRLRVVLRLDEARCAARRRRGHAAVLRRRRRPAREPRGGPARWSRAQPGTAPAGVQLGQAHPEGLRAAAARGHGERRRVDLAGRAARDAARRAAREPLLHRSARRHAVRDRAPNRTSVSALVAQERPLPSRAHLPRPRAAVPRPRPGRAAAQAARSSAKRSRSLEADSAWPAPLRVVAWRGASRPTTPPGARLRRRRPRLRCPRPIYAEPAPPGRPRRSPRRRRLQSRVVSDADAGWRRRRADETDAVAEKEAKAEGGTVNEAARPRGARGRRARSGCWPSAKPREIGAKLRSFGAVSRWPSPRWRATDEVGPPRARSEGSPYRRVDKDRVLVRRRRDARPPRRLARGLAAAAAQPEQAEATTSRSTSAKS